MVPIRNTVCTCIRIRAADGMIFRAQIRTLLFAKNLSLNVSSYIGLRVNHYDFVALQSMWRIFLKQKVAIYQVNQSCG
jgi:hypothetical protein